MRKVQVLVTISAEAVVDVPPHVEDVNRYCREHVMLVWGGLLVDHMVQEPSVTVEHFALPEAVPEPEAGVPEAAGAVPLEAMPEAEPVEALPPRFGVVPGFEPEPATAAAPVEAIAEPVDVLAPAGEAVEAVVEAPAYEPAFAAPAEPAEVLPAVAVEARAAVAAAAAGPPSPAARLLSKDEVVSLFTESTFKEMIHTAVRERAAVVLESVVEEVVSELIPLLRRHLDRKK